MSSSRARPSTHLSDVVSRLAGSWWIRSGALEDGGDGQEEERDREPIERARDGVSSCCAPALDSTVQRHIRPRFSPDRGDHGRTLGYDSSLPDDDADSRAARRSDIARAGPRARPDAPPPAPPRRPPRGRRLPARPAPLRRRLHHDALRAEPRRRVRARLQPGRAGARDLRAPLRPPPGPARPRLRRCGAAGDLDGDRPRRPLRDGGRLLPARLPLRTFVGRGPGRRGGADAGGHAPGLRLGHGDTSLPLRHRLCRREDGRRAAPSRPLRRGGPPLPSPRSRPSLSVPLRCRPRDVGSLAVSRGPGAGGRRRGGCSRPRPRLRLAVAALGHGQAPHLREAVRVRAP